MNSTNVEQLLLDNGLEGAVYFTNYDYASAIVGYSDDGRMIYDYDLMIESLMTEDDFTYEDAAEWIDYNTIRALPYMGEWAPIIMHKFME